MSPKKCREGGTEPDGRRKKRKSQLGNANAWERWRRICVTGDQGGFQKSQGGEETKKPMEGGKKKKKAKNNRRGSKTNLTSILIQKKSRCTKRGGRFV